MARPSLSLGASITRRSALATAAVIGASILGYGTAAAQTVSAPVKGVTTCEQKHGATDAGVRCAIKEWDRRIEGNIKRGNAADAHRVCTESLMSWAQSEPTRQPFRIKIVNDIRGDKPFAEIDTCALLNQAKQREQQSRLDNG
jgi:hypothetical protein